jgi:hypothetical protein
MRWIIQMNEKLPVPCEHCHGTGVNAGIECRECGGKGHRVVIAGRLVPPTARPPVGRSDGIDGRRIAGSSLSNGEQVSRLAGLALKAKPSVDFSGYWQRHQTAQ